MSDSKMNVYEKLCHIQNEMKVPKNLFNKFGGYNYRNAETILETAKPICLKYKCTLIVRDEISQIGDRYYVKAVATLHDWEGVDSIDGTAYAREEEHKKGMDASQVTGSCSSYARKYALNGLFNLDDVKDADSTEQKAESDSKYNKEATELAKEYNKLKKELQGLGCDFEDEKTIEYIRTAIKVPKVDVDIVNLDNTRRQIELFKQMIQAKKKK